MCISKCCLTELIFLKNILYDSFFIWQVNSNVTSQKTCEMLYLKKYRYIQDFSFGKIFERILTMDWALLIVV